MPGRPPFHGDVRRVGPIPSPRRSGRGSTRTGIFRVGPSTRGWRTEAFLRSTGRALRASPKRSWMRRVCSASIARRHAAFRCLPRRWRVAARLGPAGAIGVRLRSLAEASDMAAPEALQGELRPYQRTGLAWLRALSETDDRSRLLYARRDVACRLQFGRRGKPRLRAGSAVPDNPYRIALRVGMAGLSMSSSRVGQEGGQRVRNGVPPHRPIRTTWTVRWRAMLRRRDSPVVVRRSLRRRARRSLATPCRNYPGPTSRARGDQCILPRSVRRTELPSVCPPGSRESAPCLRGKRS